MRLARSSVSLVTSGRVLLRLANASRWWLEETAIRASLSPCACVDAHLPCGSFPVPINATRELDHWHPDDWRNQIATDLYKLINPMCWPRNNLRQPDEPGMMLRFFRVQDWTQFCEKLLSVSFMHEYINKKKHCTLFFSNIWATRVVSQHDNKKKCQHQYFLCWYPKAKCINMFVQHSK